MQTYPSLDMLIERYMENHQALGHSSQTISRYNQTFKLFIIFLEDEDADARVLSTEKLQAFARWLRATPTTRPQRGETVRSDFSIHGYLKDMRAFINWLLSEEVIDWKVKVPMPKLPQRLFPVLSETELDLVWNCSFLKGRSSIAVRNRAMIGLMLDTGLRRSEVASLRLDSIDLDNCLVTVIGKGNKQRRVPYSSSVMELLKEWIILRGEGDDSLFWLSGEGIRTTFRRIEKETGLAAFYPHQVRHTAASMMIRNHADPFTVQRILGHADLATTQQYVSQNDDDLRAKHRLSSPFDSMLGRQAAAERTVPKRRRLTRSS